MDFCETLQTVVEYIFSCHTQNIYFFRLFWSHENGGRYFLEISTSISGKTRQHIFQASRDALNFFSCSCTFSTVYTAVSCCIRRIDIIQKLIQTAAVSPLRHEEQEKKKYLKCQSRHIS